MMDDDDDDDGGDEDDDDNNDGAPISHILTQTSFAIIDRKDLRRIDARTR